MNSSTKKVSKLTATKSGKSKSNELAKVKAEVKKSQKATRKTIKAMETTEHAKDVMMAIATPGLPSSVRFSSAFTTGPTSLSQLKGVNGVRFSNAAGFLDAPYCNTGYVFRDPVRNCVLYDSNPGNLTSSYDLWFQTGGSVSDTYLGAAGPLTLAYAKANALSVNFQPHGAIQGVGLGNGNKTYIWSQTNYTWAVVQDTPADTIVYMAYGWTPRGEVYLGTYTSATLNTLFFTGYMRFAAYLSVGGNYVLNNFLAGHGFKMNWLCGAPVFCHKTLPQYDSKSSYVEKVRMLSTGFLFTNTTPAISRGGKIASKQFPGDEPWYEFALRGYDFVANLIDADVRDASNGAYGFLKPTAVSDFEMTDNIDFDTSGNMIKFAFDLESVRAYLGYYAVMPQDASQSAQFVALSNIEFESDDQWFNQLTSTIDPKVFDEAIFVVSKLQQFDENPLHMKDILNGVKTYAKKAAQLALEYGPQAMEVAGIVASLL